MDNHNHFEYRVPKHTSHVMHLHNYGVLSMERFKVEYYNSFLDHNNLIKCSIIFRSPMHEFEMKAKFAGQAQDAIISPLTVAMKKQPKVEFAQLIHEKDICDMRVKNSNCKAVIIIRKGKISKDLLNHMVQYVGERTVYFIKKKPVIRILKRILDCTSQTVMFSSKGRESQSSLFSGGWRSWIPGSSSKGKNDYVNKCCHLLV